MIKYYPLAFLNYSLEAKPWSPCLSMHIVPLAPVSIMRKPNGSLGLSYYFNVVQKDWTLKCFFRGIDWRHCSQSQGFFSRGKFCLINGKLGVFTDMGIVQMTWINRKMLKVWESWNGKKSLCVDIWKTKHLSFYY